LKKVLVFGAGRVARPCVQYLLKDPEIEVVLADALQDNLDRVLAGLLRGRGVRADASAAGEILDREKPDLAICLLPPAFMVPVARLCVERRIPMVDPSYVKEEMRALDGPAREARVPLLCELGLDPGIDHLSAARTIRRIHRMGGKVESFWSVCGALPAPESNDNPFGYKLSWAPASLVGASKREARILEDGKILVRPAGETFRHVGLTDVAGIGWLEHYANADSLPYVDLYDMPEVRNVYRGTLRYLGWSETIRAMLDLKLFEEDPLDFRGRTYGELLRELAGGEGNAAAAAGRFLGLPPHSAILKRMEWLGLFDETPIALERGSLRELVSDLYLKKLDFRPGETDLVIMRHRYEALFPATGKRFRFVSTLVDRGVVGSPEDTSIARTTGLPPAMGARLILSGGLKGRCGVIVPTLPEIYGPILSALEREGIRFDEREEELD
jgi:saccharopine dehydrogenase-like NADP-dependent oxidoreductase